MNFQVILIVLFPILGFSQITVTNDDFADGGEITFMTNVNDPAIDFMTTGTNQVWDFSNLILIDQTTRDYQTLSSASTFVQFVFGLFAPMDYRATNSLPSTALPLDQITGFLPVTITDINQFTKNSADSITSVGMSVVVNGTEVPFKSDTIETKYKFPLNYGDSYSSRGYSKLDMNPIYNGVWVQYKQRESIVDGWGSITTPYGTFDALRIEHFITERDSLIFEIAGFPIAAELPIPNSHIYEWITKGEKEPVLRVITSEINGNEIVSAIEYKDDISSTGINELIKSISIYPNPTSDFIRVKGIVSMVNYSIYNLDGRIVQSGIISSLDEQLNVSGLKDGAYRLVIFHEGSPQINSFVKN